MLSLEPYSSPCIVTQTTFLVSLILLIGVKKKKKKNPGSLNPKQLFYGHCSLQRFQPLLRPVAKFSFKSKELRVFFLYEGKGTQFEE